MRSCHLLGLVLVACALLATGCTSSQELRDRADDLESAADRIEQVLRDNPPGQIEESELAQSIIEYLPESWQDAGRDAIETVGDVREGAELIATKLDEAAGKLDQQADLEATEAENTFFAGLTLAETLIGTNGLIAGLAGIFWKRKKSAEAVTEDIVTSIDSVKTLREAIQSGAGDELKKSMNVKTRQAVAKIKSKL